jgi:hypothetical protein
MYWFYQFSCLIDVVPYKCDLMPFARRVIILMSFALPVRNVLVLVCSLMHFDRIAVPVNAFYSDVATKQGIEMFFRNRCIFNEPSIVRKCGIAQPVGKCISIRTLSAASVF